MSGPAKTCWFGLGCCPTLTANVFSRFGPFMKHRNLLHLRPVGYNPSHFLTSALLTLAFFEHPSCSFEQKPLLTLARHLRSNADHFCSVGRYLRSVARHLSSIARYLCSVPRHLCSVCRHLRSVRSEKSAATYARLIFFWNLRVS